MTTLSLDDMYRDEALAPFLRRYREAALREVTAANRDKLFRIAQAVQPAAAIVIEEQKK
jgi:hypothetical protein